MGALIQFKIGRDGRLELFIYKDLWEDLLNQSTSPETTDGGFVRIQLTRTTDERIRALSGTPISNQEPCQPAIQFDLR